MKSLFLMLILWGIVGCKDRGHQGADATSSGPWTVSGWYIRPDIEDNEGDSWKSVKDGPPTNTSAEERGAKQAEAYLVGFDKYVAARKDLELFEMLATSERNYNRVEYRVASDGNQIILDELQERHDRGHLMLPREGDYRDKDVFTGVGGPLCPISSLIHSLSKK